MAATTTSAQKTPAGHSYTSCSSHVSLMAMRNAPSATVNQPCALETKPIICSRGNLVSAPITAARRRFVRARALT